MAEANESPLDAAQREIREELGLALTIQSLLCIDWVPPHGPWDDTLVFVFDGGILTPAQVDTITMSERELDAFNFFTNDEAALCDQGRRLRRRGNARLRAAPAAPSSAGVYLDARPNAEPSSLSGLR